MSVPSNIAEGQARRTTQDFIRFISIAEGSLAELDTQLTISRGLDFCSAEQTTEIDVLLDEIRRMLNALRRTLIAKAGS